MLDRSLDPRLTLWLGSLAALAALNVGLWIWIARFVPLRTPYAETQLLLSGVFKRYRQYAPDSRDGTARQPGTPAPDVGLEDWREEVPWMTLYFSIGVWTSLAMALLEFVASRP